ncbi:MAG: transposase [Oscillospiraceae bacterium]|jgi:transposase|nr:transposase [Oscillospiraceae bacterium]
MNISQMEMVRVDCLVSKEHPYRKLKESLDFGKLIRAVDVEESDLGATGYTVARLVICLILQFIENLSDRQFQRFMEENVAGKWFCNFGISEETPTYSTICKFRNRLGVCEIEKLFDACRDQLKEKGHMSEVFTFIDATALVSKLQMW